MIGNILKNSFIHTWGYRTQPLNISNKTDAHNFRVTNIALNILGYIPLISMVSGAVRIGHAVHFCIKAYKDNNNNKETKYSVLAITVTQIGRGVLEMFGFISLNATLDLISSAYCFLNQRR